MTNLDDHSSWLDAHWRSAFALFVGLIVGAAVGWWLGSWTSCGSACEPQVSAIEAVGTWVGGLGTVGAVGFAVIAFRAEERERRAAEVQRRKDERKERDQVEESARIERLRREQEQVAEFARDEKAAALVTIESNWGSHDGHHFSEIRFIKFNGVSESPAYNVDAVHDRFGPLGSRTHTLEAGKAETAALRGRPLTTNPIAVPADKAAWQRAEADHVTLTFTLRGRRWQRRGSGAVRYVEDVHA